MSVLITGATAGIGRAAARLFAERGNAATRIIITGRREDRLADVCHEIESLGNGAKAHPLTLDVTNREGVFNSVANLPAEFANIDILVNNAGLAAGLAPVEGAELSDWEQMVDTNIKGLLYTTKAVVPGMVERKNGHIVNIGSVAGSYPLPNSSVYCGTKAFVNHMSLALRAELIGKGVRVTSIEPGNVETEFSVVRFKGDKSRAESIYEGKSTRVACTGEDIADIIHYCTLGVGKHVNINRLEVMPERQGFGPFAFNRE